MKKNPLSFRQRKGSISLFICFIVFLTSFMSASAQGVAISSTESVPDPNAMLDIISTDKGILIPRMDMATAVSIPATMGLFVYIYDVDPGFWYNDGAAWTKILNLNDKKWAGAPDIYCLGNNVGIGTSIPSASLDVEDNTSSADGIDINNTGTGDPQLRFQLAGTTNYTLGIDNSDADKFKIGSTSVSSGVKMTMKTTGEVGIGTENPSATLHVNGTVKVLGAWETSVTQGVNYQAASDGFVVAGIIINAGSGDANGGLKGYTDSNTNPTNCRGLACVRKYGTGTVNGQESFTMPVRKGDYWRVDYTYVEGSISFDIDWIPFGTGNP